MAECSVSFRRRVPIRHRVDVLVAGGGPAGVTAAVAAARQGAKVMIVEQTGCLGGLGTSGLVPGFCTLTDGEHLLADGLGREIVDRLRARGGTGPDDRPDQWWGIPFQPEALKLVYDQMVTEAAVDVRFYTGLVDVLVARGRLKAALVAGRQGLYAIEAKVFVDGTGDGLLAVLAGAPWELGDAQGRTQAPTLVSVYANVDWDRYQAFLRETHQHGNLRQTLERAIAEGAFTTPDLHHSGAWRTGRTVTGMNVGHVFGTNGIDDGQLTEGTMRGRRLAQEYLAFYQRYVPGYEKAELVATGALLGVRETRRIIGHYVLTADDFLARASFDDEIGRYNYPIDIHCSEPTREAYEAFEKAFLQEYRYQPGESYGIPYRSLVPLKTRNLLVAGRCFSTDRRMQGSTRVMPACFITGQAAGVAAALCASSGAPAIEVDRTALKDRLRRMGAYVPH